jgi:hypothetical protein
MDSDFRLLQAGIEMKFSIRDLFLVTVIVALAVGWANEKCRHSLDNAKSKASIDATNNAWEWQLKVNAHLEQTLQELKEQASAPNLPKP